MPQSTAYADIRASWRSVRTMQAAIGVNTGPHFYSLIPNATGFARLPESLLLVFAMAVLETTLLHLRDEGEFSCRRSELGAVMYASMECLAWQDFPGVDAIRAQRNQVPESVTSPR